jgi:hypothetical protein
MNRDEAAAYLRVSPSQVSNLVSGKFPGPRLRCTKAGARLLFRKAWLIEYLEDASQWRERSGKSE